MSTISTNASEKPFKEYPALISSLKDEQGNFYNLRAWSPRLDDPAREAGDLRASISVHDGNSSAKTHHALDLKAKAHEGQKYFSGIIERGEHPALLVRIVSVNGKEGRYAAMRIAALGQDAQGESEFIPIKGQGGTLCMNDPLMALSRVKDTYEVAAIEKHLDVMAQALAPKELAYQFKTVQPMPSMIQEADLSL
jgi:hypothetical protein